MRSITLFTAMLALAACSGTDFSDIQPLPASDVLRIDDVEETPQPVQANAANPSRSSVREEIKETGEVFEAYFLGTLLTDDRRLSSAFLVGTGSALLDDPMDRHRNVLASVTVSQTAGDYLLLSTELPDERLIFENVMFPQLIVPWAAGSKFRIKGEVRDFVRGYVFKGDPQNPLRLELDGSAGLKYVSGQGDVVKPDGELVSFPR